MKQPGVTILKLHGSLRGVGDFIFDGKGMVDYHAAIRQALGDLTAGDIMVCGYAYNDQCVISSFSKDGQGHVVVVDPEPSSDLCDVGKKRGSLLEFRDKDGYFDGFFQALSDALKGGQVKPSKAQQERPKNPFKFLEAYRREDAGAFFGRDARIDEVVDGLRRTGRAFFILGPANDGKTSMVRAGVIPRLQSDPAQAATAVLYLRCQPNLEAWLLSALERERRKAGRPPAGALNTAMADLAAPPGGRSYLVLDQFERVVRPYEKSAKGQIEFNDLLARLVGVTPDTVTVVCIARHEGERMFPALLKLRLQDRVVMLDYDGAFVEQAIKAIAAQEHIEFEDAAVKKLRELYETTSEESRFTLAHVNAVCHLLCESGGRTLADLQPILDTHSGVLNRLINHFDVMGFMEDVPDQMAARSLLPRMMKLVFLEGRQDVAECLSCQLEELLSPASTEEESHAAAGR
jgi:hypothetical protein